MDEPLIVGPFDYLPSDWTRTEYPGGGVVWSHSVMDGAVTVAEMPTGVHIATRLYAPECTCIDVASSAEEGRRMALEMLDAMRRAVTRG